MAINIIDTYWQKKRLCQNNDIIISVILRFKFVHTTISTIQLNKQRSLDWCGEEPF